MKIQILGENGNFGSFLKELLSPHFEIVDNAQIVILAIPISAYEKCALSLKASSLIKFSDRLLINVCSVQKPSMDILLKYTENVTGLHPLFGRRTPENKRYSILTYSCTKDNDTWQSGSLEIDFLNRFRRVSDIMTTDITTNKAFTPELHDILMRKTHVNAVMAAKQLKVYIDAAKDIPDFYIPHSFRLMREFVETLDDMPSGTMESILANPYA